MKTELYIYDKVEAIKTGQVETVTYSVNGVQYAAYSGESYESPDLTLEQYLEKKNNPNLIASTWEVFEENIYKPYLASLQENFKEITEEQYFYNLECVPPRKWHNVEQGIEVFWLGECYTANLYRLCICLTNGENKKYYAALRPITLSDEKIKEQLREQGLI